MKYMSLLLICALFFNCTGQQSFKINGVSFVASSTPISEAEVTPVVAVNANWAAVMPFGFLKSLEAPVIQYNVDRQWWGEKVEGARETIRLLKKQHIKVMLKPQIWVWHGEFTGNISMATEKDWQALEESYAAFILCYAKLAEEMEVPVFCIGTELHSFVQQRPQYWEQLIEDIKTIYTGKLTYAENWDQYQKVPFWNQIDFIGIDAYFPLSASETPTVEELRKGWKKYKKEMKTLYDQSGKPVLFTEYGYRSINYTAKQPWDSSSVEGAVNLIAQQNALQVIYEEFWNEPWFLGGFLWKWYHNHTAVGGMDNNRFTIQNKPAEKTIKELYKINQ
ncbi:glycoside hydrolase [Aquimarina sp. TRL1]|uniref:glycoside hydrolase family 113 n=1 Tax=Aquimarina sp. (strain TRL1) TaxID=2736252 RepID=UPI00158A5B61|nr:glycoside hydrolase [Aquimarina sp. TRL1]QKX04289.1 glycoside hydrolase [Aquimarina sp. TRL1]